MVAQGRAVGSVDRYVTPVPTQAVLDSAGSTPLQPYDLARSRISVSAAFIAKVFPWLPKEISERAKAVDPEGCTTNNAHHSRQMLEVFRQLMVFYFQVRFAFSLPLPVSGFFQTLEATRAVRHLSRLRTSLSQDAVELQPLYPHAPCYRHEFFASDDWKRYVSMGQAMLLQPTPTPHVPPPAPMYAHMSAICAQLSRLAGSPVPPLPAAAHMGRRIAPAGGPNRPAQQPRPGYLDWGIEEAATIPAIVTQWYVRLAACRRALLQG